MITLEEFQKEAARVNSLQGLRAFLVGALSEIGRCRSLDQAQTVAEMAIATIAEYDAGIWHPGPGDDPADWRPR